MNEHKKYNATPIPRREAQTAKGQLLRQGGLPGAPIADALFAELEIAGGTGGDAAGAAKRAAGSKSGTASGVSGTAHPAYGAVNGTAVAAAAARNVSAAQPVRPQPVGQRMADPVRQKIYDMRSLAAGNPYAMKDASLFYRQAKFMEDFTDDFSESEAFSIYYPCYQLMGYRQLRTYFTWRTKVRRGEKRPVAVSYIFLYIYELLSNIGTTSYTDGLDKLLAVWNAYRESEPDLDKYLPRWLKDYHIYYPLPHSFMDFVEKHALWKFYLELLSADAGAEGSLAIWRRISSYDIAKSSFYNAGNEEIYSDCFYAVLNGVRELFAERNVRFENLFIYNTPQQASPWHPFPRALFHPWLPQPDRQVTMPGQEIYTCKDGHWTTNISMRYAGRKEVVGYLMKRTEACLRQALGYKYKLAADPSAAFLSLKKIKWLDVTLADLDGVIEKSVADFHRDMNRTVVTVNHDNLARIRDEALGTQHRLTVPEDDAPQSAGAVRLAGSGAAQETQQQTLQQQPQQQQTQQTQSPQPALSGVVADSWAALKDALSAAELQALALALRHNGDIKAFADESRLMPELLADSINEKAVDHIGDNLLEMGEAMAIYDEYKENVAEMVGLA